VRVHVSSLPANAAAPPAEADRQLRPAGLPRAQRRACAYA
jgi:hypothetical protein